VRKIGIAVIAIVLVIVGLVVIFWVIPQATRYTESEIATSVAQEIIRENLERAAKGYTSPEGIVIAEIDSQDAKFALEPYHWFDAPYHTVWKYEAGVLKQATTNDAEAIKRERNAFFYLIMVRQVDKGTALVDIVAQYPQSSTVGFSDGGYASHWQLKFVDGKWRPVDKDDYLFWD